jgi:hypothetical protein
MPSGVGLLEQREVAARSRVDGLREEADRIQAELAVAEREWPDVTQLVRLLTPPSADGGGEQAHKVLAAAPHRGGRCRRTRERRSR